MKPETQSILKKYLICFGVASAIAFVVIWINGFFTDSISVNLGILSDAFSVSGMLLTLFAGMLFVSGEGALVGLTYVLRNVALAIIPMGRAKHERYADYRERKLQAVKKIKLSAILVTGVVFLTVGVTLTIIWSCLYY